MDILNAEQSIKRHVLIGMLKEEKIDTGDSIDLSTADGIDAAYEQAENYIGIFSDVEIIEAMDDFRCGGQDTNLVCREGSRNYESERVAIRLNDGRYVSWVYWSGGGKFGEPEDVDWIEDAFFVNCEERQEMVTIYNFSEIKSD